MEYHVCYQFVGGAVFRAFPGFQSQLVEHIFAIEISGVVKRGLASGFTIVQGAGHNNVRELVARGVTDFHLVPSGVLVGGRVVINNFVIGLIVQ